MVVTPDLALALQMADLADEITLRSFRAVQNSSMKADGTLVTAVDLAVEACLVNLLYAERPSDTIVSEETYSLGNLEAGRVWILDPLDQTVNYSRGREEFATLIALHIDGRPSCAVVSAPAMRKRWWAEHNQGAWNSKGRLHVSNRAAMKFAVISLAAPHRFTSHPKSSARFAEADQRLVSLEVANSAVALSGAGGFLAQMAVAEGAIEASIDPWGEPWDIAAPALIVTEAGGRATDLDGHSTIASRSSLMTNGVLHRELLTAFALGSKEIANESTEHTDADSR